MFFGGDPEGAKTVTSAIVGVQATCPRRQRNGDGGLDGIALIFAVKPDTC
jgi:hypothetical protein